MKTAQAAGRALASALMIREVGSFITDTIDMGRSLDLASRKLGVNVDELERFRYAASMAGLDTNEADRALMMLNRTMGSAAQGNKAAAKELGLLGGKITDAHGKALPLYQ